MNRTVVDIGASVGLFASYIARQSTKSNGVESVEVFALEPIPESAAKITNLPNLRVIQKAVLSAASIPNSGTKLLNLMTETELSSFLEVNPEIDKTLWGYHLPGLKFDSKLSVECITLESLIQEYSLKRIDFLKIDTQGTDLEVLTSAGKEISKIMSCVLEFPYFGKSAIYSNETDLLQGIEILKKYNFFPVRIVPNGAGECNVFFLNSLYTLEEYFRLESDLQFQNAPTLKIGNHNHHANKPFILKTVYSLKTLVLNVLMRSRVHLRAQRKIDSIQ